MKVAAPPKVKDKKFQKYLRRNFLQWTFSSSYRACCSCLIILIARDFLSLIFLLHLLINQISNVGIFNTLKKNTNDDTVTKAVPINFCMSPEFIS